MEKVYTLLSEAYTRDTVKLGQYQEPTIGPVEQNINAMIDGDRRFRRLISHFIGNNLARRLVPRSVAEIRQDAWEEMGARAYQTMHEETLQWLRRECPWLFQGAHQRSFDHLQE